METRILVTGAPGNVGTEVVKGLIKKGAPLRIGAYSVEGARQTFGDEVEIVHFDFLKPETFRQTFAGVDRLFLVRPPALSNVERDIAPAIWAAVGAGVKHIVFLSIQGVENNKVVPHYKIEQLVLQTGVSHTFLRASFFMQNLSTTHRSEIRDTNEIAVPVGKAKTSFIDARDIAAVAVRALTESGHENQRYTLTGSEALDYHEVAGKLSQVLNRPIRYTNPSVVKFLISQLRNGNRIGYALVVTALYTITRFGNAAKVTDEVHHILDREPISFDQFARDYKDAWTIR
ncbi:MAG: SDR family oxidoreductase [Chloroflexota bacterium]